MAQIGEEAIFAMALLKSLVLQTQELLGGQELHGDLSFASMQIMMQMHKEQHQLLSVLAGAVKIHVYSGNT